MKRFYCTICRRLKRVRKYPVSVENPHAEQPEERQGTCSKHNAPVMKTRPGSIKAKVGA